MLDDTSDAGSRDSSPDPRGASASPEAVDDTLTFDDSIAEEIASLIDDAKTYAQAELQFQKTRAGLAGKTIGIGIGMVVVAIILLHIALLALAVGLVIALQPLLTIWGAIAIVVGGLLLATGLLVYAGVSRAKLIAAMFASNKADGDA